MRKIENEQVVTFSNPSVLQWPLCIYAHDFTSVCVSHELFRREIFQPRLAKKERVALIRSTFNFRGTPTREQRLRIRASRTGVEIAKEPVFNPPRLYSYACTKETKSKGWHGCEVWSEGSLSSTVGNGEWRKWTSKPMSPWRVVLFLSPSFFSSFSFLFFSL